MNYFFLEIVFVVRESRHHGLSFFRDHAPATRGPSHTQLVLPDELPGYFESRASAWDKIRTKTSKESKTSTSSSKETGGKVRLPKVFEDIPPWLCGTQDGEGG